MRGLTVILVAMLLWPAAVAAPWVRGDSELYARLAVAREDVQGLELVRADLYGEFGLSERWTITGKVEGTAFDDAEDFNAQGWRTTARRKLFQRGSLVGSVEFGALQGAAIGGANGCDTLGAEVRGGVAWSGKWRKFETFMFSEVAGRFHADCQRERYEFGLGQKVTHNIWTITQVWIERGTQNAKSDKIQTELLWAGDVLDVSVGYRQETGGQFQEDGVFVALARHF